jgi:dihydrofolate synthase/folylpolyglutamate synthase
MMHGMDFSSAVTFLASLNAPQISQGAIYGFSAGIERTRRLIRLLGVAQEPGCVITVTGSKGKGSTSCMLAAILAASGYKVGLFTGPHLYDYRERIQVCGEMISQEQFVGYVERIKHLIDTDAINSALLKVPTTFECLTAMAVSLFYENEVNFSVLEVGIGGRLDAVNAVDADLAVFTSISLEHTETLGHTVEAIATEKAGIVRPHTVAVSVVQPQAAMQAIQRDCQQKKTRLVCVEEEWMVGSIQSSIEASRVGQTFSLTKKAGPLGAGNLDASFSNPQELFIPLLGEHQVTNATLAVATVNCLPLADKPVTPESVRRGLSNVRWPGRLEIVGRNPITVVDGAHNPDSAHKLMRSLKATFQYDRLIVVIGIVYSKDIRGILEQVAPYASTLVVVGFAHRRAAAPQDILSALESIAFEGQVVSFAALADGLKFALDQAASGDLVCATGSLYVAARARETFLQVFR